MVLDQGGELHNSPAIKNLFRNYGYEILPTSQDASYQNEPMERAHHTIYQGVKALLIRPGLDMKFWLYEFMHVLSIQNALPGQDQDSSPLFLPTDNKDNFHNTQVFGCHVWVCPTGI